MADKKLVPGQTVYLKEGESFDSIELAKREAEMMKELPPTIKLGEKKKRFKKNQYKLKRLKSLSFQKK